MAIYQDIITQIRAEVGDYSIKRYETADGDGVTSVFPVKNPKISDVANTLTLKVGGVVKTENTHFTVNRDFGQIIFTSGNIPPSGNDNIDIQYESVNLLNADYIVILNDLLYQKRKKLWTEFDTTVLAATVLNQKIYPLAAYASDIISLNEIEYRTNSNISSSPWIDLATIANIIFYRTLQQIEIKPVLQTSGWDLRIKGIRAFARGATVSDNFEPTSEYWNMLKKYIAAEYWRREGHRRLKEVGAVTNEKEFVPINAMLTMAKDLQAQADLLLKEIKLPRPARKIGYLIE